MPAPMPDNAQVLQPVLTTNLRLAYRNDATNSDSGIVDVAAWRRSMLMVYDDWQTVVE